MSKIHFFWANGTSSLLSFFGAPIGEVNLNTAPAVTVPGINGQTALWDKFAGSDPFPKFLNPDAWTVKVVGYPASIFPAQASIDDGVTKLRKLITDLPAGTPYCLGGFSQGAAVCSKVLTQLQAGDLGATRLADMKGAVMYGNPCRKTNSLWPAFGGYAGGLFSGAWDVPGSTTGGHGAFPAALRLTSPPERWFEFAGGRDNNFDPVNSTGDSTLGTVLTNLAGDIFNLPLLTILGTLFDATKQNAINTALSFAEGHGSYATQPPPGYAADAPTSYQIGLEYLESIAKDYAVASDVLPATPTSTSTAGWTTSLIPPAA